ncbi:prephenate dehydratase [Dolichospermum circinale]|uniref:prephenate dehydratase n=1 Tax=Dolichospermum circinale TaxID=109265 RepID=UPI000409769E|nr:prephenate dehydratase [Dolichospermum circinale]MDB9455924.1 prephenate dehydratase [Dolichospermum circinale CS-541/06]MDB9461314.1 prephenate dehydratase [Dolichospermum circinale CS-541/04]MDB9475276.1 prephenate dehydratase [Dolichospermum circinale CS-537/11]MDB9478299.1 prephenate dehydratase [Dolichospermum circinale CS-537/03]MDB9546361.1 prephenate dehydratase [Dolichospermum circinale CS-1031]
MNLKIAHLGPPGTYAEQAAFFYVNWLQNYQDITPEKSFELCPYPTIAQSLQAIITAKANIAVVPVENSIEGSVNMTLDSLWQLDNLKIKLALVLPIQHTLVSRCTSLDNIKTVYSHPQALAQCQGWLAQFLPNVNLIASNSTTEALQRLEAELTTAAISSSRAAQLYNLPILAEGINDYPENCTRFWVVSTEENNTIDCTHTSLAFSVPANVPGALVKALEVFAHLGINLSRIESRPTKRSLGEYLFYLDIEADVNAVIMKSALGELQNCTEILKIFGSYRVLPVG